MDLNKDNKFLKYLIGLSTDDASKLCLHNLYKVRVTRKDSTNYICTQDLCLDRINLEIDNDVVTKCYIG